MPEIVGGFAGGEVSSERYDTPSQAGNGSLCKLAQVRLEFAEGHFDWIEVRRVFGQIVKCCAALLDRVSYAGNSVGGKTVHHDRVVALEGGRQTLCDIGQEGLTPHGAVDHTRRRHCIVAQSAHESDGLPVSLRGAADQALAAR